MTDDKYLQKLAYVFELRIPGQLPVRRALLLGPSRYSIRREFLQAIEHGQDGGKHVYEYGSALARISMTVDPGAAPQRLPHDYAAGQLSELSGHGRYLDIRDTIFEAYSDAKKTAAGAGATLILHVLKDEESWVVVPVTFGLERDRGQPIAHPYSFELIGVEDLIGADRNAMDLSTQQADHKSMLDTFANPAKEMRRWVQRGTAAIDDLTASVFDLRMAGQTWLGVIDDVGTLISAAGDLASGMSNVMRLPHAAAMAIAGVVDTAAALCWDITQEWAPSYYMRELTDAVHRIAAFRDQYGEDLPQALAQKHRWSTGAAGYSPADLQRSDGTLRGSGAKATDTLRVSGGAAATRTQQSYGGWVEVVVRSNDTPAGLEARYNVPWADIAAANRLRAPYISTVPLPGTVAPGQKIVVPRIAADNWSGGVATGNANLGSSQQEDLFGTDLRDDPDDGIAIDFARGATDFLTVSGIDLMEQAVRRRLQTEKGTNPIHPTDGLPFQPGSTNVLENQILARVAVRETLAMDKRIKKLAGLTATVNGDTLQIADVEVILSDQSSVRSRGVIIT